MDEYLKTLLEQIRCKKARPYVKKEFQDHIEDQIEANMQAGMDREQAEREAVRDMGDPVETGDRTCSYDDFISSGLHCTGKIFENNCRHFTVCLSGYIVGWLSVKWGKILHCTAGRKRNIHADSDAVLCSHIWSNFV